MSAPKEFVELVDGGLHPIDSYWNGLVGQAWRAATAAAHEADALDAKRIANLYPHSFDHRHGSCPVHGVAEEIAAAIRSRAEEKKP